MHRARAWTIRHRTYGNLVNEAALWAARQNRKFVMMVDFEMSKDKV